mmetsp:Transcript_25189/g.34635  ORF Transcript_25189/g.34635 Transcript_25189/m.34635 type:complete len:105 (+) Transcript_25189:78-392(+)
MNEDLSQLNFQDVCDNKLANKTKANYNNRIKAFIKWLRTNYPTCFKPNDAIDDNSENDFDSDLILTAVSEEMLEKWNQLNQLLEMTFNLYQRKLNAKFVSRYYL